jgi:hypothetical protein
MMKRLVAIVALVILAAPTAAIAGPLTIGMTDTFQTLTTEGWFAGGLGFGQVPPLPPAVVGTGGPAGAGDAFLVITAGGGSGPGSRLVAINGLQWTGDFLAAGIGAIGMDLINLGATELTIRLLFENPMGAPPTLEGVTSLGAVLPAGSGWTHVVFPIDPASLALIESAGGTAADLLSDTTLMRIIHASSADDPEPVAGVLGVDNIQAIPEPATLLLLGAGVAMGAARRRTAR